MKDWEQEVLNQYDIDVKTKRKVRSGVLCEGEDGGLQDAFREAHQGREPRMYEPGETVRVVEDLFLFGTEGLIFAEMDAPEVGEKADF